MFPQDNQTQNSLRGAIRECERILKKNLFLVENFVFGTLICENLNEYEKEVVIRVFQSCGLKLKFHPFGKDCQMIVCENTLS